ncbi:MAG: (d)CMP kinase [Spirochaetaceae bacterium]
MVVAIDGPAGSGKSTIARCVADRLGYFFVNSGNLYRAVSYYVLSRKSDPADTGEIRGALKEIDIDYSPDALLLNGTALGDELRTGEVDHWVSRHSAIPEVRRRVNDIIRRSVEGRNAVVEGRDMTTVVFPDAEYKFYLDASLETRARRRMAAGTEGSVEEVMARTEERDRQDREKAVGSLRRDPDSTYLDTSDLTIEDVCETVIASIQKN